MQDILIHNSTIRSSEFNYLDRANIIAKLLKLLN